MFFLPLLPRPLIFHRGRPPRPNGYILILLILVIVAGAGVLLVTQLGAGLAKTERFAAQSKNNAERLAAAKAALLGYVLRSDALNLSRPGYLPVPDSLDNSVYNGKSETKCLDGSKSNGLPGIGNNSPNKHCLGKFPWQDLALDMGSNPAEDPNGVVPWLAVSNNLVSIDNCVEKFNSDLLNRTYTNYTCPSATALPHPWLTVRDSDGNVLSSEVAVVLIMPGPPLTTETRTQSRTPAAPGHPIDYLDSIRLPLGCTGGCTTYDNAGLNNVYVQIPPGTVYPANAANVALRGQVIPFNDTLIYLTKDEVMQAVEKRVVNEMAAALKTFKASRGVYPWMNNFSLAPQTDSTTLISTQNIIFGAFPFMGYSSGPSGQSSSFRTDFGWSISGATEIVGTGPSPSTSLCVRVQTSPSRWMRNSLAGTMAAFTTGTATEAGGTCAWKGTNTAACNFSSSTSLSKTFNLYSNENRCINQTAIAGTATYTVNRQLTVVIDAVCSTTPVIDYSVTTPIPRLTWQCNSVPGVTDLVRVVDSRASDNLQLGKIWTAGIHKPVTLSGMRTLPLMPYWFYSEDWYKSAFAAIAPASAPVLPSPNPCSAKTTLTVGAATNIEALAILAGKDLQSPVVSRPNTVLTNYLEAPNVSGGTTCSFAPVTIAPSTTYNDRLAIPVP